MLGTDTTQLLGNQQNHELQFHEIENEKKNRTGLKNQRFLHNNGLIQKNSKICRMSDNKHGVSQRYGKALLSSPVLSVLGNNRTNDATSSLVSNSKINLEPPGIHSKFQRPKASYPYINAKPRIDRHQNKA